MGALPHLEGEGGWRTDLPEYLGGYFGNAPDSATAGAHKGPRFGDGECVHVPVQQTMRDLSDEGCSSKRCTISISWRVVVVDAV